MTRFTTTYSRDYSDPKSLHPNDIVSTAAHPCPVPKVVDQVPSVKRDSCCHDKPTSEWTGIAPMGLLLRPNVIPLAATSAPTNNTHCGRAPQPAVDPAGTVAPTRPCKRMFSTYAADYSDAVRRSLSSSRAGEPVADDFRTRFERGSYAPIWRPKTCLQHCPATRRTADNRTVDRKRVSEYMGITSHTGGIIMRYKLNDHKKCMPWKCEHLIPYAVLPRCGR